LNKEAGEVRTYLNHAIDLGEISQSDGIKGPDDKRYSDNIKFFEIQEKIYKALFLKELIIFHKSIY
jgi:hypothetical protein